MRLYPFCSDHKLPAKTFYRWIANDKRSTISSRIRPQVANRYFPHDEKLKACELRKQGVTLCRIADIIGCTPMSVKNWYNIYITKGEYYLMSRKDIESGSISELARLKAENELLKRERDELQLKAHIFEETLNVLKNYPALCLEKNLSDLTNLTKTEIITNLRAKRKYKLKILLEKLQLKEQTYYDNCRALTRVSKYKDYDNAVLEYIRSDDKICGKKGYREVINTMLDDVFWVDKISERRIRRVMQDNDLLAWQTKSMKRHNSYKNDGNPPVKNWLYDSKTKTHFFKPDDYWEILGTDVTEFHVNGFKVYFSPIIDFKDSMPITWRISKRPDTELIVGSVKDLISNVPVGKRFILHMDQGSVNRSHEMKKTCRNNHILQSMSGKGKSGDNAPVEGFFGRLKQEWFNKTDFTGYTYEMFVESLNRWLDWYCNKRHSSKLGGLTPMQARNMVQLNKVA